MVIAEIHSNLKQSFVNNVVSLSAKCLSNYQVGQISDRFRKTILLTMPWLHRPGQPILLPTVQQPYFFSLLDSNPVEEKEKVLSKLHAERIERLEALGFVWDGRTQP